MTDNISRMIERAKELQAERGNFMAYWQDLAEYVMPAKADVTTDKAPGQKLETMKIYDSTAIQANQVLAAGLHSYLTNPSSKWFSLRTQDKALMDDQEVKIWFKACEDVIYNTLNTSNFSQQVHEMYLDLGCFGTGVLYEEEDPKDIVRFYSRPLKEVLICEDDRERVDSVYRLFKLSARQARQAFGENAGEVVNKALENKDLDKKIEFLHVVEPRYDRNPGKKDSMNMPYSSTYIEVSKKHVISQGGYEEFPFFVPRFNKATAEPYGYSPAMICFSDVKVLQLMEQTILRAAQKLVDPPLVLPHEGFIMPFRLGPGALNYRMRSTGNDVIEPLQTGGNIPIGMEMADQRRTAIKQTFFVDLFLMLSQQKNMTATEVQERVTEKMLILAQTLGRLMSELLDPIIYRTFGILFRKGMLPPPPDAIQESNMLVEYVSPLAKAQRITEITSLSQGLQIVGGVAQFKPEALDKLNGDEIVDEVWDIYGINPRLILDDEQVMAIREQRAKQQQMQQMLAGGQAVADIAKTGSEVDSNMAKMGSKNA